MKKQKSIVFILSIIIMICVVMASGCNTTLSDEKLYNMGIEMTTLLEDMLKNLASLSDTDSSSTPDSVASYLANDYDTPIRTYVIEVPSNERILEILMADEIDKINELPENVREQLCIQASFTVVLSEITFDNTGHYDYIVCSTFYVEKTIAGTLKRDVAFLYTFETGKPIVVYYHQQSTNSILATARFIGNDIYSTLSDTREVFEKYDCNVTEYK